MSVNDSNSSKPGARDHDLDRAELARAPCAIASSTAARSVTSTVIAERVRRRRAAGRRRRCVGGVAVEVEQRDPVPADGEAPGHGEAHARCGAGDHRDPAHRAPLRTCASPVEYGPSPELCASSALEKRECHCHSGRAVVRVGRDAARAEGAPGADRPDDRPREGPVPRQGRAARRRRRGGREGRASRRSGCRRSRTTSTR